MARLVGARPLTCAEIARRYRDRHPGLAAARAAEYRRRNPEKAAACARESSRKMRARLGPAASRERQRGWELKARYGITAEEFNARKAAQGGVCAMCGTSPKKRELNVDHSHATGAVRALLCHACNTALGLFNEDPALLRRAAEYVESHNG